MPKGYDCKCGELAEHFLEDNATKEQVASLAQHIQEAVEDWLSGQPEV